MISKFCTNLSPNFSSCWISGIMWEAEEKLQNLGRYYVRKLEFKNNIFF